MTPEQIEKWLAEISAAQNSVPTPVHIAPKYRPPLDAKTIAHMRHMRREGFTVGDIARAVRCSWETARRHTKGHVA